MARSIGFDHVGGSATSFVWDLTDVAERVQDDQWVQVGPGAIDILLVGGGGAGGGGVSYPAIQGGGGGGGFVVSSSVVVDVGIPYVIEIGAGGLSTGSGASVNATPGGNSVFKTSAETTNIVAYGGGRGGQQRFSAQPAGDGGSGGGASFFNPGTPGSISTPHAGGSATTFPTGQQGFPGGSAENNYRGAGGGGAGGAGAPTSLPFPERGRGGPGAANNFKTGSNIIYAGGGGGNEYPPIQRAPGGGGKGRNGSNVFGAPNSPDEATADRFGVDGLGGGGGKGGHGGSGVVVLRYPNLALDPTFISGAAEKTTYSTFKSFTFTSNAVIQFS